MKFNDVEYLRFPNKWLTWDAEVLVEDKFKKMAIYRAEDAGDGARYQAEDWDVLVTFHRCSCCDDLYMITCYYNGALMKFDRHLDDYDDILVEFFEHLNAQWKRDHSK